VAHTRSLLLPPWQCFGEGDPTILRVYFHSRARLFPVATVFFNLAPSALASEFARPYGPLLAGGRSRRLPSDNTAATFRPSETPLTQAVGVPSTRGTAPFIGH